MRLMPASTLLAAALLAGCASLAPATAPTPDPSPAETPVADVGPPADDSLNATAWFQTSVERDLVYRAIYRAAAVQLPAALADKRWDALQKEDRGNDPRKLPPAIIVDVDETVLDNSPSSVRQIREQRGFDDANWNTWVNERKAKALPGAAEFLNAAAKRGVTVFYISNRTADQAQATIDNLRATGFPIKDASQFLGLGTVVEGCEQEGSEKSCRRQLVGRGYRVLMQFGDQVGDFVQIWANTPEGRRDAIAPYADWIGQRWWALPNPLYGSWEPALFNNAWSQPAAERRAQKEAALDDAK
jgi:acid phosphatase